MCVGYSTLETAGQGISYEYATNVFTVKNENYLDIALLKQHCCTMNSNTLQPLYNTVHYNTVLDITQFKNGSQKCIDYIEK